METILQYGLVYLLVVGGITLFAGIVGFIEVIKLWWKGEF